MKTVQAIALVVISVTTLGLKWPNKNQNFEYSFECKLSTTKTIYKIGEVPELNVEIINNSGKEVYFIGSLDASDVKWRKPYCYYTIEKPVKDSISYGRCKLMNELRTEDFIKVEDRKSFDPYMNIDGQGFFGESNIQNPENFRNPGTYKVQFHYSSQSDKIVDYNGDANDRNIVKLFQQVPKIELESNVVEIIIKND